MHYRTEIKRREYDGKFMVWKQIPYGVLIGATEEEIDNVQGYTAPEWVITGIYDTRGKAYRASGQDKTVRRDPKHNNRPAKGDRRDPS